MNRREIIQLAMFSWSPTILPMCKILKPIPLKEPTQTIDFIPTGKTVSDGYPDIRNIKMNWGRSAIKMTYSYEEGFVKTKKGTKVLAYKFNHESLKMELFNRDTKETIQKPVTYFEQFGFDLSYNCFGYCFAGSSVFITNPTAFVEEEYEEVALKKADLIIFKNHNGFGDTGEELIQYFHAVRILPNGNVSFKPGINKLVENVPLDQAIHNYNFNHKAYYKRKRN